MEVRVSNVREVAGKVRDRRVRISACEKEKKKKKRKRKKKKHREEKRREGLAKVRS